MNNDVTTNEEKFNTRDAWKENVKQKRPES